MAERRYDVDDILRELRSKQGEDAPKAKPAAPPAMALPSLRI